ncbi:MAG: dipeptidase [Oligosphaeraceae bacterium]|nr:dipeptidase [Oligosphaeraceae bacterium]
MQQKIDHAREVALNILKPTPSQLQHGLELHQQSLVWDAYGFSPNGRWQEDSLDQLCDSGAGRDELSDAREYNHQIGFLQEQGKREEFALAWREAGVNCIFQNAGREGNCLSVMARRLSHYTALCDRYPELLRRAVWPEQVEAAARDGVPCICPSSNGVPIRYQVEAEESLLDIRVLYSLGIRMMHLTYNRRNLIGDGCGERADSGLSEFGHQVIRRLNELGVIPDVAHSGQQTSLEAARCSSKPVVASHSTAFAVNEHIRAKKDQTIRAICDSGGYIGVCAIPPFLGGSGDIAMFLNHLEYLRNTFGAEHVAIGTDHGITCGNGPTGGNNRPYRRIWESYWPEGYNHGFVVTETMNESLAWSNWPLFTVGMVQRGFSDAEIQKIIGGNVLRVCRATFGK